MSPMPSGVVSSTRAPDPMSMTTSTPVSVRTGGVGPGPATYSTAAVRSPRRSGVVASSGQCIVGANCPAVSDPATGVL